MLYFSYLFIKDSGELSPYVPYLLLLLALFQLYLWRCTPAGSRGAATPNQRKRKGNAKTFRGGGAYTNHGSFNNSADTERESHGNSENETGLRNRRSVWNVATQGYSKAHFATFPEKLIEPCILAGCRPAGIVLDPFIGSGTTAVVAEKNGREFIGIDLNPDYTELSKKRIEENQ